MTLDKRTREQMLAHCGELHGDDGVDPRQFFKSNDRRDKQNYKARQLCNQVAQTLSFALAGDFGDERLQSLQVASVEPAPDTSLLSVTVRTDRSCDCNEVLEMTNLLAAISGQLRCEIAAAISRKRTPKLQFRIVGPSGDEEVQP
jgi:ribosome-binding factor A